MMIQKKKRFVMLLAVAAATFSGLFSMNAFAEEEKTEISGMVYEFDKNIHYEISGDSISTATGNGNTYGTFFISGEVTAMGEKAGIPSYEVGNGNLTFYYNYGDTLLNADEDVWHLIDDKSKEVADMKLDANIMKGAIILQTSGDQKNWVNVKTVCNAFSDVPVRTSSIYKTTDVQLINGCYYRILVAYELSVRTEDSNILFIDADKHDYKKCAEVYEFYAYTSGNETDTVNPDQTYNLGTKVKVKKFDGYFGEDLIDKKDVHYGWELGNFFVSGYTDETESDDGTAVFLKNVGDKVTLWFNLKQNIDHLNDEKNLSVTADKEGYDQYFETPKMDFGRGALIIRYTDYNNIKSEPVIYTNYLEADTVVGADTKVQLFEEGDYEVALDYEVTRDELIDKVGHYRIFFKFSVRNGNCMVYPFDVKTGNELTNSSMTENGFRLDLAKSRYLKINLKREILKDSADGLIEDTRFNGPAKDGAEYTDEGIYTITVNNKYTGQFTTKKIYVGTNKILRAHMVTGLPILEINNLVSEGAKIAEDGTIQLAAVDPVDELAESNQKAAAVSSETDIPVSNGTDSKAKNNAQEEKPVLLLGIIGILVLVLIVIGVSTRKKKKHPAETANDHYDDGGDTEQ